MNCLWTNVVMQDRKFILSSKCKINVKLTVRESLQSHIKIIYQVEKAMYSDEEKIY